jgi:homoserine kinase type II
MAALYRFFHQIAETGMNISEPKREFAFLSILSVGFKTKIASEKLWEQAMAVYTLLNKQMIEALLASYAIGQLVRFEPVSSGIENTNYFLWTKDHEGQMTAWVLTVFEHLPETDLPFFNRLTRHLFQLGFCVPAPVGQLSGNDTFRLSAELLHAEQAKTGVIVPRFNGAAKPQPDVSDCAQIADFLARMHLALQDFPATRAVDHDMEWFKRRVLQLELCLNDSDAMIMKQAWQRFLGYSHQLDACPSGLVHGDLFRDNVLFDNEGISGVIDFYHAGYSPLLFDLAVIVNDWAVNHVPEDVGQQPLGADNVYDERKLRVLIDAYAAVRQLTSVELMLLPRFLEMAALRFWLSRLQTLHLPGYQQQIKEGDCVKSPDEMKRILLAAMAR